jgi:hypothetical protein
MTEKIIPDILYDNGTNCFAETFQRFYSLTAPQRNGNTDDTDYFLSDILYRLHTCRGNFRTSLICLVPFQHVYPGVQPPNTHAPDGLRPRNQQCPSGNAPGMVVAHSIIFAFISNHLPLIFASRYHSLAQLLSEHIVGFFSFSSKNVLHM